MIIRIGDIIHYIPLYHSHSSASSGPTGLAGLAFTGALVFGGVFIALLLWVIIEACGYRSFAETDRGIYIAMIIFGALCAACVYAVELLV